MKASNEKNGFSLVQVMMVAGLVGGLSLIIMELVSIQQKASRKAMVDQDLFEVVNRVQTTMLNADACRFTMAQFNSLTSPSTGVTTIRDRSDQPVSLDNSNIRILSIEVLPPYPAISSESNIKLRLNVERNLGATTSNYAKEVGVTVITDATNRVTACFSSIVSTTILNTCTSLGGTMVGSDCVFSGARLVDLITDFQTRISNLEASLASIPSPAPTSTPGPTLYNTGNCSATCTVPAIMMVFCNLPATACNVTLNGSSGVVSTPTTVLTGTCSVPAGPSCPVGTARSCTATCTATNIPL